MEPEGSLPHSQDPPPVPFLSLPTSWRFTLILSSHLSFGLPSGLFLSGFPTKTLCAPLLSPIRATCPAHLILFDLITRTFGEEYPYHLRLALSNCVYPLGFSTKKPAHAFLFSPICAPPLPNMIPHHEATYDTRCTKYNNNPLNLQCLSFSRLNKYVWVYPVLDEDSLLL